MERDLAGLSMDVDSVSSHLQGYGFPGTLPGGEAYDRAVPRTLELLAEHGARCTFFLIAGEARRHPAVVRSIAGAGHEIGSHSMSHTLPFNLGDEESRRTELGDSRKTLEDISGEAVTGFRAPGWDAPPGLPAALAAEGYTYDASFFPSWMLLLHRWLVARKSGAARRGPSLPLRQVLFGKASPHLLRAGGRRLAEIPIATVPLLRIPHYHTMIFLLPRPFSRALGSLAMRRRSAIAYVFHALDFLDTSADGLDSRISRHPGMALGLKEKMKMAGDPLTRMRSAGRDIVSLGVIADLLLGTHPEDGTV